MSDDRPEETQQDLSSDEDAPPLPPPQTVLAAAADESRGLPFADLPALSAPDDATVGRMLALWPQLTPPRRRDLLAALQQLAEDDVTLDFQRIQLSALHDPDVATRILAIRGLWESEREQYADVLIDLLRDDAAATVRAEAAGGLAHFVVSLEFGMLPLDLGERIGEALRERIEDVTDEDEVRGVALEGPRRLLGGMGRRAHRRALRDRQHAHAPRDRARDGPPRLRRLAARADPVLRGRR